MGAQPEQDEPLTLIDFGGALASSSTKRRVAALISLRQTLQASSFPPSESDALIQSLFKTYPFYQDRPSRRAVLQCLRVLLENPTYSNVARELAKFLKEESSKGGIAPANAFVLVEWGADIIQQYARQHQLWAEYGLDLVVQHAKILERCLSLDGRGSIKQSALVVTRRALRKLFNEAEIGEAAITTIVIQLTAKSQGTGPRNAVLLGVLAGVCARLDSKRQAIEAIKDCYYSFYIREILGSRSPVANHIVSAYNEFFANFITVKDLQECVVPAFEKALLRAPEVVLNDLMSPMVKSLPPEIDIAEFLADRLLRPLLANIKSQNPIIRNGVMSTLEACLAHSFNEICLKKVAEEILLPLTSSKINIAEQRTLHARMLCLLSFHKDYSKSICSSLALLVSKEPNEVALASESLALAHHFSFILMKSDEDSPNGIEKWINSIVQGLSDKRPSVRKAWALRVGEILRPLKDGLVKTAVASKLVDATIPKFTDLFDEVTANPQSSVQSGLAAAAYVAVASHDLLATLSESHENKSLLRKSRILERAFSTSEKGSILNHRLYTKLAAKEEMIWAIRAFSVKQCSDADLSPSAGNGWSLAFLFFITAADSLPAVRKEAAALLRETYYSQARVVGQLIIRGLWTWYKQIEDSQIDSASAASKTGNSNLYLAVRSIFPSSKEIQIQSHSYDSEVLRSQLLDMLILAQPEILPRVNWIELCLRVGQDPGELARANALKAISLLDAMHPSANLRLATCKSAAELAFVCPDIITPLLVAKIRSDLSAERLSNVGPFDVAIARHPKDTPFIDVLSNKGRETIPNKSSRDYETMKWEQEIRNQLAQKKGQEKKLTVEERAKLDAQLAKEAKIRKEVLELESHLRRGIGFIHALATGPPTEAILWMGPCLETLFGIIAAGAGRIVENDANEAYITCSNLVSSRLGSLRPFIGIATLRPLESVQLPVSLCEEPLGDLVTRLLYRLRFSSEQRSFDTVSLAYVLPLVFAVLRGNGLGVSAREDIDEQLTLALEFLSFHAGTLSDGRLPRNELLALLIESMQRYTQHYRAIKDCLFDSSRACASNLSPAEASSLVKGTLVPQVAVRGSVLQAIRQEVDLTDLDFSIEIWIASHDDADENAELGQAIWEENAFELQPSDAVKLVPYLEETDGQLRRAAARSLAECISDDVSVSIQILTQLEARYRELAKPRLPERDEFGMPKKTDLRDPWEARSGIATAFREMATKFKSNELLPFVEFLVNDSAIGDRNPSVRGEMIECATSLIAHRGSEKLGELMPMFERTLDDSDQSTSMSDLVSEAVVILYGALACHLEDGDERVPKVVEKLLTTLSTPSETVQYAVAACLPPLVRTSNQMTGDYLQYSIDQLFHSKKYAARRGAAYGLAGIVSGKGISALRELRILSTLRAAVENKKDQTHRQGAFFAYELLSLILGPLFEPFVLQLVPQLLSGFGDSTADVREACLDASKVCFANLSSYGVKQILPILLDGLNEQQWRSKKGACDLLGAMAYLDPQQLAMSLPDIIPPLTNVLTDSHKEVRTAANRSLQRFGEVINNPEIKGVVNILLRALSDPTKFTDEALDALIKISFVHYLDSPSLALIVRILGRGLSDRSGTKRKSAQIIGSLAHLTDRKDIVSHLPVLVTGLKLAVVDPVPATRATASKALGSLVEKLGEDALPDLIPSLMATLKSDTGAGDRLGSAQALSEVLAGLGTGRLQETLPTILQNVASTKPTVREGFISLFIYLPACFGNSFANYLSRIIPPILSGLADEIESIRETSLRAGRLLVKNFATKAIDLLLPELDRGLGNDNYRIRLSSVELVGDLLFNLTGLNASTEQDEIEEGATEAGQSLLEVLGEEKRNRILSSLYICRCDTSGLVRSAAINVWKALVATPRTLKELVPTLSQRIIQRLASSNVEQKVIAGNALGELIRKAGEGVLATLLPSLEEGLQTSTDSDNKQGICIALREVISSASEEALEDYEETLISVVRVALVDSDAEVREAAAEAFDSLQKMFGKRSVDQILPHLLNLLRTEDEADTALSALLTLLTDNTRSNVILPNLVPTLLISPVSSFNAKAIASLSKVAGPAMTRRLPIVLNTLMENIEACEDDEMRIDLVEAFDTILVSVDEYDGLNTAMSVMLALVKHGDHRKRAIADERLGNFFEKTELDYSRYHQDLIRVLLISFDDGDRNVVRAAVAALTELTKHLRKEGMEALVFSTRQVLQQVGVPGSNLPGFMLPKGINAILPIFLHGLMNGTTEQRIQAALAISDIIDRTGAEGLKPFVTQITGPLIRVVSERSTDVKSAILFTLNNLLEKIPTFLKPFLPQLQRTFAKSLADPTSETLRSRAAKALGTLITLTPRIDPLIAELITGSKTPDPGVQNAMTKALYEVVSKAGSNMNEASRSAVLGLIDNDAGNQDETMAITNARLLGALIKSQPPSPSTNNLIKHRVVTGHITTSSALALNAVLLDSPATLWAGFASDTLAVICQGISNRSTFVQENCILAAGKYLLAEEQEPNPETARVLLEALARAVSPGNPIDTRRLSLVVIRTVSRNRRHIIQPHISLLAPPVFASVRDPVIPVKLAAEAAFLAIFSVVESESGIFNEYITGEELNPATKRSMQDYFKRVAVRLGNQARERKEAEGGQGGLGLSNDEREDEREIWSVGKVDLGESFEE
ncbi:MAG: hypothetical protein Q9191_003625 [Dirinaria sp. TL-2023a]